MPKERINTPDTYPWSRDLPVLRDGDTTVAGVKESTVTELRTDPALFVGWQGSDAGHVQVAMEMDIAHVAELLDAADDGGDKTTRVTMYTGVLDRAALNRLIRVLRRARDAAYGRDE